MWPIAEPSARGTELQRQAGGAGLRQDPDRQREHHDVDDGPAEIDELADRLHAVEEDQQLEQPHEQEAEPAERGQAEEVVVRERFGGGIERQHQRLHGLGGEIGLHAVPDDADDAAQAGRDIGAHDAERHPRHHRERRAVFQRGTPDQVHQEIDRGDADHHRQQHFPAGQPEKEQTGRKGIAADRMHVGHPHREDAEDAPGPPLRRDRRQIVVIQSGIGAGDGEEWRRIRMA